MNNIGTRWNKLKDSFEILKQDFVHWLFPLWITPNDLSGFRIFLSVPIFVYSIMDQYCLVLIIFTIAILTDFLDGPLARKRGQTTKWGAILDSLADKLTIMTALSPWLSKPYHNNYWIAYLVLAPDIILAILAGINWLLIGRRPAESNRKRSLQSNKFGKIKMFLQSSGVILLIISNIDQTILAENTALIVLIFSVPFSLLSLVGHLFNFGPKKTNKTASP